jgi:hypothetical protein
MTQKKDTEISLFNKIKSVNQEDCTCNEIRKALQENKKSYDEMLFKRFKIIENILFFKENL